jgi:cell division protein FtsB
MAKPLTDKELLEGRMSYLGRGLTTPRRLLATIDKQAARIKELEAENKAMREELDWLEGK